MNMNKTLNDISSRIDFWNQSANEKVIYGKMGWHIWNEHDAISYSKTISQRSKTEYINTVKKWT
jgi:hypothetical protein